MDVVEKEGAAGDPERAAAVDGLVQNYPDEGWLEMGLMLALVRKDLTAAEKLEAVERYSKSVKGLEVDEVGCE